MTKQWINRGWVALGLFGASMLAANAGYPDFEGVQARVGNPSPSASSSNVNDYTFQDEQVNVNPDDGQLRVLRTNQKVLVNDYVVTTIPLKHASTRELRNVFRVVTQLEGGRVESLRDQKSGLNYLYVVAPKYMIPFLEDAVRALDVPYIAEYNDGASDLYLKVQHREASAVDFIAANYAGSEGFSTIDTTNNAVRRFDEVFRNDRYAKAVAIVDIPANQVQLEVKIYEVNTGNDLKLGLDYINWKNGPGRNLFTFAEGYYSASGRARSATSIFDPFIDARATVLNDTKAEVLDSAARESYRAVNYLLTSNFVDFLQSKGKAKLVHEVTATVASANTATITAEDTVLAFVNNTNEIGDTDNTNPVLVTRRNDGSLVFTAPPQPTPVLQNAATAEATAADGSPLISDTNKYQYLGYNNSIKASTVAPPAFVGFGADSARRLYYQSAGTVGVTLTATPYVGLESAELVLDLQIGDLNGLAPNGTPIINTRTISTTVRLLDGQPFVIGGLKRVHHIENTAKAPFLGSIPVLGYLFGGENDAQRDNDLVVTVTPRFVHSSAVNQDTPPSISTMDLVVNKGFPTPSPELNWGFDQWLLDSES